MAPGNGQAAGFPSAPAEGGLSLYELADKWVESRNEDGSLGSGGGAETARARSGGVRLANDDGLGFLYIQGQALYCGRATREEVQDGKRGGG